MKATFNMDVQSYGERKQIMHLYCLRLLPRPFQIPTQRIPKNVMVDLNDYERVMIVQSVTYPTTLKAAQ